MAELRLVLRREGCRLDHQTSSLFRPLASIPVLECRGGNRGERCATASSGRAEQLILKRRRRRSERCRFSVRGRLAWMGGRVLAVRVCVWEGGKVGA